MRRLRRIVVLSILAVSAGVLAYPMDGFDESGIRRLELVRMRIRGIMPGPTPPPGGRWLLADVRLRGLKPPAAAIESLPAPDADLQRELDGVFGDLDPSYGIALLDLHDGSQPRYATRQPERTYAPGSVGKLAIAAGLFAEMARLHPGDTESRQVLLRERLVVGDEWIGKDRHPVPFFAAADSAFESRPVRAGDVFSMFEWADHMMSASANSAASTVWKEVMLMRAFGDAYPPSKEQEQIFFKETPKAKLQQLAVSVVNEPLRAAGIPMADFQLGTFFTNTGQQKVPGMKSWVSPQGALLFLLRLEQGRLVDRWSSLQIKRLMYTTGRRIRYVSAPALNQSAVYFKSGSLFACRKEEDFQCGRYMGNIHNYMNSVAIIEPGKTSSYQVALMSNVLRKNSALDHQALATRIDAILRRR